jgi:hypothetical protein
MIKSINIQKGGCLTVPVGPAQDGANSACDLRRRWTIDLMRHDCVGSGRKGHALQRPVPNEHLFIAATGTSTDNAAAVA